MKYLPNKKVIPFRTFSGHTIDLFNPDPNRIDVFDMAHGLARICRYTGSMKHHYSVAQHCVLVSKYLQETKEMNEIQLEGLLHDAAEYLTGDLHGPTKNYINKRVRVWNKIEVKCELAVGERFDVSLYPMGSAVKMADKVLLKREKLDLLRDTREWNILEGVPLWNYTITPWPYKKARDKFLERFFDLWLK
jgi:hypothetical protein